MANGEVQNAPAIEEAADQLGDSQDERQDDWSPDDLNEEQRAQYERGVAAVDDFVANNPRYRQTESNRELILGYLADHDLPLSPASLALAYEQLGDRLDLEPEQRDSEEQPESEEDAEESEPEPEEPKTARGKPIVAWRNGKQIEVGA